jgi:glutamine synthetase
MRVPSGADPAEAKAFLKAHPDIEAIDIVLTDANGVGRGKIIRRGELAAMYRSGRNLPTSILGLDITGEDVHETGLVWETGDGDLIGWPIPGTLRRMPGAARGQLLMSMYGRDGAPMGSDPRHALARQLAAMGRRGLRPAGAFELEFFLLANDRDASGRPRPAAAVLDGRPSAKTEVYSVDHLHGMTPLFDEIYAGAELQGLPVETLISEYAPGQYELTLHYRDDLLAAADDLVMLKRLVRSTARRHGITACFMAKPFEQHAGSGMHLHVSLPDRKGVNRFAEKTPGRWAPELLHALGGMLQTLPESMLVFAPHANSWRRFVSRSYAPVSLTWGVNNRSVALRIPAGETKSRRIEHRPAGVDANPYLTGATAIAALAFGLDRKSDPGPETTGNGYEAAPNPAFATPMPVDWRSAIEAAAGSAFLQEALGADMHRTFLAIKRAEHLRVARTIPELDYALYLHEV